jgi:hypothetical protein
MAAALTLLDVVDFLARYLAFRLTLPYFQWWSAPTFLMPAGTGHETALLPKAFSRITETALLAALVLMASTILPMLLLRRLGRSSTEIFVSEPTRAFSPLWLLSAKGLALLVGAGTTLSFVSWGVSGWLRRLWNLEALPENPYLGVAILSAAVALWINAQEAMVAQVGLHANPTCSALQLDRLVEWRRGHKIWHWLRLLFSATPALVGALFFLASTITAPTLAISAHERPTPLAVSLGLLLLGLALLTYQNYRFLKHAQVMAMLLTALSLLSINDCLLR